MDRQYIKAALVTKADGQDGRKIYTFRATSDAVDRTGEVVTLDGWDFKNWEANPVILDSHDYYGGIEAIVGRGVGPLRLVDGAWEVDIAFSQAEKGRLAEQLVEEGSLRAVSVGFNSQERTYGKPDEPMKHTRKELLEISVCPIPANQDALRVRGLSADERRGLETKLFRTRFEDMSDDLMQAIADLIDGKAGRVLSRANETSIRTAADLLQTVLSSLGGADDEGKSASGEAADAAEPVLAADLTAMRAFVGQ
jgi:HK97 family phage prohead protease